LTTLKYIGYTFFILAIYVLYESIQKLYTGEISEPSILGILITTASLIVIPFLFYYKYQTGKALESRSLIADSKETLACLFLSGAVLIAFYLIISMVSGKLILLLDF
jgi:divalent metal cation (Fe/Co/Zn/Cd) transporter